MKKFLLGLFLLTGGTLGANQVHFESMDWNELTSDHYWVLKVTRENLKWEPLVLKVPGKNAESPGKPIPDFVVQRYKLKVLEVLNKGEGGPTLQAGKVIEVFPASAELNWSLHQRYYLEGLAKSPVVLWLSSSLGAIDRGPWPEEFLVVIRWVEPVKGPGPSGWHLAVDNAWESVDKFPLKKP